MAAAAGPPATVEAVLDKLKDAGRLLEYVRPRSPWSRAAQPHTIYRQLAVR